MTRPAPTVVQGILIPPHVCAELAAVLRVGHGHYRLNGIRPSSDMVILRDLIESGARAFPSSRAVTEMTETSDQAISADVGDRSGDEVSPATLVSVSTAANHLHISQSRVRQLLRDGTLQGRLCGRRWEVEASALDEFNQKRGAE